MGERRVRIVMLFTACRCGWFERWEDCARGVEVCVTVRLGWGCGGDLKYLRYLGIVKRHNLMTR